MDRLKELISRCKNGVYLEVNPHRDVYESVEEYFENDIEDVEQEVFKKMCENDIVIRLQFYPTTAVGFYLVYHYDLDLAIEDGLDCLGKRG